MKTKIIYISGSEIFDMGDIRTAFDQVRDALQLGTDTVLFGVPVDKADALSSDANVIPSVSVTMPDVAPDAAPEVSEPVMIDEPIVETPVETSVEIAEPVKEEVVVPKKTRGRPKSVKKAEPETAPVIDTTSDAQKTDAPTKVVSILSVLTSKQETVDADTESVETVVDAPEITPDVDIIEDMPIDVEPIDATDGVDEIPDSDGIDDIIDDDATQVAFIDDMITDDAPVQPQEKTLEQLLESMTPLREDLEHEQHIDVTDSDDEIIPDTEPDTLDTSMGDDATLEQLATEFAENQDKIETNTKPENHGKIGKLKNILPFKKARRDDAGLMGDLFGWAGIAANDEDFAIPGFFTNAASKK